MKMNLEELKTKRENMDRVRGEYEHHSEILKNSVVEIAKSNLDGFLGENPYWEFVEVDDEYVIVERRIYRGEDVLLLVKELEDLMSYYYKEVKVEHQYGYMYVHPDERKVILYIKLEQLVDFLTKYNISKLEKNLKIALIDLEESLETRKRWVLEKEENIQKIKDILWNPLLQKR